MRTAAWVLGSLIAAAATAAAQAPAGGAQAPAPPMTNLQIIPKDTPRPQVLQMMQQIAASLGVQCTYCHVMEGRGGRTDMAADDKPTKKAARGMMLLTRDINGRLPDAIAKSPEATTRVGCATCHRGVPIPRQITDVVTDAAASGGAAAGLTKYRELREKFYGGQSYDFSENGLIATAQRAMTANRPDDALTYLQANVEYYPKSARSYLVMSQAHLTKQDKAAAMKDLEKAIEIDPNNAQARAQLENLRK
jgi:Photosynthetic reaction centre cytochrome C subunit/Tetratricopeptide repeat